MLARVFHDLKFRAVHVREKHLLSDTFIRIVLQGEALQDFVSLGFDDHVKLLIPTEDGQPIPRNYTPRSFNTQTGELTIDFERHPHGLASTWAEQVNPGDAITVAGPRASLLFEQSAEYSVLVGDNTALPAIARYLETCSDSHRCDVFILAQDAGYLSMWQHSVMHQVRYFADRETLLAAVSAQTLLDQSRCWVAGEAQLVRELRKTFKQRENWPTLATNFSVYWQQGKDNTHQVLEDE